MIGSIVFVLALGIAGFVFGKSVMRIRRNILLGKDVDISDNKAERWDKAKWLCVRLRVSCTFSFMLVFLSLTLRY